jgi:hypothetical protein
MNAEVNMFYHRRVFASLLVTIVVALTMVLAHIGGVAVAQEGVSRPGTGDTAAGTDSSWFVGADSGMPAFYACQYGHWGCAESVALLTMSSLPAAALEQGPIPVAGSFNYTPEILASATAEGYTLSDATEQEVWIGDFVGTAVSPFPLIAWESGARDAWLLTEWHGEWMIVSGTGDLENLRGHGVAWGPGSGNAEEGMPHIYYRGTVMFLEPSS